MTVIAYRDGLLAADTGASRGNTVAGRVVKICHAANGALAAAAGGAGFNGRFLRWASQGEAWPCPEAKTSDECHDTGIIFRPDGAIELYEPGGMFVLTAPYFAIGSGRDQALGAMFVGADAEAAVRAAIAHDVWTNGDVVSIRHKLI
jgi:20S proteasome alpha/beta subunit